MSFDPDALRLWLQGFIDGPFPKVIAVAGGLGGLLGALLTYLARRRADQRQTNHDAAAYVDLIATSLDGVVAAFEKLEVPYAHGNTLNKLVANFEGIARKLTKKNNEKKDELLSLVQEAHTLADKFIAVDPVVVQGTASKDQLTELEVAAKRIAGKLRAASMDYLRAPGQL